MGQLSGKVAIITGAASGMGKAASMLFAREGANVVLADLNVAGGEATAAKAGVVNLTRSASIDLAYDFIRVNCIAPGGVSTPILYVGGGVFGGSKETADAALIHAQPLPTAGQPEDIAQAALFLASEASRFITGHTLVVDGGATAGAIAGAPKRGAERHRPQRAFAGPLFEA